MTVLKTSVQRNVFTCPAQTCTVSAEPRGSKFVANRGVQDPEKKSLPAAIFRYLFMLILILCYDIQQQYFDTVRTIV